MAQQGFGRRGSTSRVSADQPAPAGRASSRDHDRNSLSAGANCSSGTSIAILAAVGGLVALTALGGVFAYRGTTRAEPAALTQQAATQRECHGQAGCTNQYDVALSCGSSEEARTVSVIAADAEAAERKAERYNRECRSRSVVFVAGLAKSAAANTSGSARGPVLSRPLTDGKVSDHKAPSSKESDSGSRARMRFGRR